MAKITITISDDKKVPGKVCVSAEFDPPIKRGKKVTAAQRTGAQIVQALIETARESEADDEDEEG